MMNIRKNISLVIAVITMLSAAPALHAQDAQSNSSISFSWGVTMPIGDNSFTNKSSFITPRLGYEYRFASNFSAGLSLGFSYSDEKGATNDRFDGDIVTGNSHRKQTLVPIQVEVRYFPLGAKGTALQPYVGVSGGVQYAKFYITAESINTSQISKWAEVITPQIGLRYQPQGKRIYVDLSAQWQHSGNGWEMACSRSQQNIGIMVGVGYSF